MRLLECCDHGKTWKEECTDCKLVWIKEGIKTARKMLEKYEQELEKLENKS